MNKLLIFAALLLTATAQAKRPAPKVEIITQELVSGGIRLTVENTTGKDVWVFVECPNVLTTDPIRISKKRISKVLMRANGEDVDIQKPCIVNHYRIQNGHSPEHWTP